MAPAITCDAVSPAPDISKTTSAAHMQTTPTSIHLAGINRTSPAPRARHPSAVTRLSEVSLSQPVTRAVPSASPSPAAISAGFGPRTTARIATKASAGVATAASTTSARAIDGAASGPNVPIRIDPGSNAAHAGDRKRCS